MVDLAGAVWRRAPRRVLGGTTGVWFIDCKRYTCTRDGCTEKFYSIDPHSVKLLPSPVIDEFGVRIGLKSAVDSKLAWRMFSLWRRSWPSARITQLVCDEAYSCYLVSNEKYWAWCNEFVPEDGDVATHRPGSLGLMGHVVTGDAARDLIARQLAAPVPARSRAPTLLKYVKGLGESKINLLRVHASIRTAEELATFTFSTELAMKLTGRRGTAPSYTHPPAPLMPPMLNWLEFSAVGCVGRDAGIGATP